MLQEPHQGHDSIDKKLLLKIVLAFSGMCWSLWQDAQWQILPRSLHPWIRNHGLLHKNQWRVQRTTQNTLFWNTVWE